MVSVYALPVSSSGHAPSTSRHILQKRKRTARDRQAAESPKGLQRDEAIEPEEYAAVLTPGERNQRRLAGHSLLKALPIYPFPHKAPRSSRHIPAEAVETEGPINVEEQSCSGPASLRLQHLSAMSAVLHQSLSKNDYARARRALGLILRTHVQGIPIDIRAAGNWGIGAEVLLRQYDPSSGLGQPINGLQERRRRGFAEAKDLYEMLIVQYPFHRSHPDSVNAIDFYLAMFSLWIYVAQADRQDLTNNHLRSDDQVPDVSEQAERRRQELQQANEIGARMDKCMATAPYFDNRNLLRLRAMVAEWQADLSDDYEEIGDDAVVHAGNGAFLDGFASTIQDLSLHETGGTAPQSSAASTKAREQAKKIYERIGRPAISTGRLEPTSY